MSAAAHTVVFDRAIGRWLEAFEGAIVVANVPQALPRLEQGGVAWVDIAMLDSFAALRAARPDVVIVAMTLIPSADEAVTALNAGARGYCHALAAPEMLRQVALVVCNGGIWLGPDLMARAAGAFAQAITPGTRPALDVFEALTPRERAVALQVAEGAANKEIARRLNITLRTVKAHLSAIFDKLGVRDRLQLVVAVRRSPAPRPTAERESDLTCTTVQ